MRCRIERRELRRRAATLGRLVGIYIGNAAPQEAQSFIGHVSSCERQLTALEAFKCFDDIAFRNLLAIV